jgi:arylsulfatase A-like enzyme
MPRRALVLLALVILVGSLSERPAASAEAAKMPKNVLFLIADDLNCDLHCYGHPHVQTPNIDKLAKRGVLFEHAYCQFPLCGPSRTSFLTGRRPNETQIVTNPKAGRFSSDYTPTPHFREFIPDTITLPQVFRNNGYFAARVGKLFHYGVPGQIGTSGLDDPPSWEYIGNPAGRDKAEENKVFTLTPGKSYGGTLSWLAADGTDLEQTDGLGATAAISLLEAQHDRPFFLATGFYRPHTPYVSPKKYFDLYPLDQIELPKLSADDRKRVPAPAYASAKKEQETMTDHQRREAIQAYWASISFVDAQVGRVLEALDRLKLTDNTVVVFCSDHGYHMYEHGLWQKMSLFENSAHVPLIIADPACPARGKAAAMAELVDLYPTLADLCGLKTPDYIDGASLVPVLKDTTATVKSVAFTQIHRGKFDGYSVRTPQFRYTSWDHGKQGEQLYDLTADPGETKNLAGDQQFAKPLAGLRKLVEQYQPK